MSAQSERRLQTLHQVTDLTENLLFNKEKDTPAQRLQGTAQGMLR